MQFLYSNAILESEFAVLQATSEAIHEGYYVHFHNHQFPNYYDGNSLWCLDHPEITVNKLIEKWNDKFPEAKHKSISLNSWPDEKQLVRDAEAAGFTTIEKLRFMIADTFSKHARFSDQAQEIKTETDWEDYRKFIGICNPTIPWYVGEGFEKIRAESAKMPIHWFILRDPESNKILSSAGIFKHRHLGRFQNVLTHPEEYRKGYSTQLLRHMIRFGQKKLGVQQVILYCDPSYHAYDMYRKLGFTDRFDIYNLKNYPE